jgi:hypothetical protein
VTGESQAIKKNGFLLPCFLLGFKTDSRSYAELERVLLGPTFCRRSFSFSSFEKSRVLDFGLLSNPYMVPYLVSGRPPGCCCFNTAARRCGSGIAVVGGSDFRLRLGRILGLVARD